MTTWSEHKKIINFPKLEGNISVDVVIIGGGITGILNAYALSGLGKKVALLEKGEIGSYASMYTTAFITEVIDSDLTQIVSLFGEDAARGVWQSGMEAIEEFDRVVKKESINCEFARCSNYIFASTKKQFEGFDEEFEMYKRLGLPAVLNENGDDLKFKNYGYIEIPNQAKFHITKFIYSLAEKISKQGVLVFENSQVLDMEGDGPVTVLTTEGSVKAKDVIIATYGPITNKKTHLKKGMYRSYALEARISKNILKEAIYEDAGNPYYYFRVDPQVLFDRVILGGEDHRDIFGKKLAKKSFESLENFLSKILKGHEYTIIKKWDGPILEPSDGLSLIGEIQPHYYVATAFSGNGMTYSMISSFIFKDLLTGKENTSAKVYDPKRAFFHPKRLASKGKDYIQEFFGGALKNMLS